MGYFKEKLTQTLLQPCEDCISREDTIKEFQLYREYLSNMTNNDWVNRIETVLKILSSVTPKASWIPVSELPKMNGEYLVTLVDEDSNGDDIFVVDKAYWTGAVWTYKFDGGEYCIKPIAYMPLPEPYKIESEEEE